MRDALTLRWAGADDYAPLGEVMFDAVRRGASPYSEDQRAAWIPSPRSGDEWSARLSRQKIILAEEGGRIAGFMSLDENGYVDLAFIRPEARGAGLFRRLYDRIEEAAIAAGEKRLHTHASLMAEPAFAAMGFHIVKSESVELRGQLLPRFAMEKFLRDG